MTPENILEDIEAVYRKALAHPKIDSRRLVVFAHSEGVINVARLVEAARIAPAGILNLCGITASPKEILRWQCVDRYVEKVLTWDQDGDRRVTAADAQKALLHDEYFSLVGFSKDELIPVEAWTEESLRAFFESKFELLKEASLATPDDAPYPKPSGDVSLVMGSYRWFKQYFVDDRSTIDLLQGFPGRLSFHFGEVDSQLPSAIQMEKAKPFIKQFTGRLKLYMHKQHGHVLRNGHPSMGPMEIEAIAALVSDAKQLLPPNKTLLDKP